MVTSISMSKFLEIVAQVSIIDIRTESNYNNNHIPGARNIPFQKLLLEPTKYLDRMTTYYIYCQKGSRSITVCQALARSGYRVVNVSGGYEEWILQK